MGSLSRNQPKHLLEVAGEPFLVHQLRWLAAHDVREVVLATSYLAERFQDLLGDGGQWGIRLRYATEVFPLGTAGGLVHAARLLAPGPDALVVVINGDLLTRHDLGRQLALATPRQGATRPAAVLHLRSVTDARAFGSVVADGEGGDPAFVEKSQDPPSLEVNAGTYVLRRSVIDAIPAGVASLETDVLPGLVAGGQVIAYREQALWEDVGTPDSLLRASRSLVTASGRDAHIDASALVDVSARVDAGSAVGPDAVIGRGATVTGSIVMRGATVQERATLRDCVVGPRGNVAPGALLVDEVVL